MLLQRERGRNLVQNCLTSQHSSVKCLGLQSRHGEALELAFAHDEKAKAVLLSQGARESTLLRPLVHVDAEVARRVKVKLSQMSQQSSLKSHQYWCQHSIEVVLS